MAYAPNEIMMDPSILRRNYIPRSVDANYNLQTPGSGPSTVPAYKGGVGDRMEGFWGTPKSFELLSQIGKFGANIAPDNPVAQGLAKQGSEYAESKIFQDYANKLIATRNAPTGQGSALAGLPAVGSTAAPGAPAAQAGGVASLPAVGTANAQGSPQTATQAYMNMSHGPTAQAGPTAQTAQTAGAGQPAGQAAGQAAGGIDLRKVIEEYLGNMYRDFQVGSGQAPALPLFEGAIDPRLASQLLGNALATRESDNDNQFRKAQKLHQALDLAHGVEEAEQRRLAAVEEVKQRMIDRAESRDASAARFETTQANMDRRQQTGIAAQKDLAKFRAENAPKRAGKEIDPLEARRKILEARKRSLENKRGNVANADKAEHQALKDELKVIADKALEKLPITGGAATAPPPAGKTKPKATPTPAMAPVTESWADYQNKK